MLEDCTGWRRCSERPGARVVRVYNEPCLRRGLIRELELPRPLALSRAFHQAPYSRKGRASMWRLAIYRCEKLHVRRMNNGSTMADASAVLLMYLSWQILVPRFHDAVQLFQCLRQRWKGNACRQAVDAGRGRAALQMAACLGIENKGSVTRGA